MIQMKHTLTLTMAILIIVAVIGWVTVNIHQVYAPRNCGGCIQFKKLTNEFEKNVIQAIRNPDTTPADIRELHKVWEDGVLRIFPPNTALIGLLEIYQEGIFTLFEHSPPGHKPVLNEQIKEFKHLTHTLRTEVLDLAHDGFLDEPR